VDRNVVRSSYKCNGNDVVVELRHPSKATSSATQTQRFAVTVMSGTPPPELMEGLLARIRDREAAFEWVGVGSKPRPYSRIVIVVSATLLALLAIRWVWRQRH
jgi:hypothetical protein